MNLGSNGNQMERRERSFAELTVFRGVGNGFAALRAFSVLMESEPKF
jgi:hypothetical protein